MPPAPNELDAAMTQGDPHKIARCMVGQDFTLIEDWDERMEKDDVGAMILEVDGFPALVAFTSEECAARFVQTAPDLLAEDGTVPGFVVAGDRVFEYLPEGFGLILNPETEEACYVLPPDLAAQVKLVVEAA